MAGAIKCVQYGIPRTKLKDRLSGRVTSGSNPGPLPYLTSKEDELVQHLLRCTDIGYSKTKQEVLVIVRQAIHKKIEDAVQVG